MSTEFGLLMIGCTIGVCWDLLWRGIKWLIEKCVDLYFDWKDKSLTSKDTTQAWERITSESNEIRRIIREAREEADRSSKIRSNLPPGSYTTGGDMDPAFKGRMREAMIDTDRLMKQAKPIPKGETIVQHDWYEMRKRQYEQEVPKDLPKGEPVKSHNEAREFIKKAYEHEENKGSFKFKMPEGFSGVDFGKAPASTACNIHLITDKGNVIVPGVSFLDDEGVRRAHAAYKISKAWDLALLLRSKGRKFSPSSNPLGDTAAFMAKVGYRLDYPSCDPEYIRFRHRKGGRRE